MASAYHFVVERCPETGLYVGHVPGIPGAHSQGADLTELARNLEEVLDLLGYPANVALPGEARRGQI